MIPDSARMTARQKTLALIVLVTALVLEIVDTTIVNTALPAIRSGIHATAMQGQWIVAGYSLCFALLLMAGGRLGDSHGYARVFVWGVAGFTLASLACALARDGNQLVAARLAQGAIGAIMAPQAMALMQVLFDPLERVARLAMFGLIGGVAAIAGPILGGLLIGANLFGLGWRLVFLINLPVGVAAIAGALCWLPASRSARAEGFDMPGVLLFGGAVAGFLWPLIALGERVGAGRPAGVTFATFGLAAVLFAAGWRHVSARARAGRPALFDPAILAIPTFRLGLIMATAFATASGGFLLVFAYALQTERGASALMAGLMHMPFGLGAMGGIAFLSRKLLPRHGRLIPLTGALLMATSCAAVLLVIGLGGPLLLAAPGMILAGTGMGMTTGCIGSITLARMDRDHAGAASGLLKTCQQLGSALGVAIPGSAYFAWAPALGWPPAPTAAAVIFVLLLGCAAAAFALPVPIFAPAPYRE